MSRPIRTLLVANRGEIAVRVFRTAKALGISTVAVASDADKDAPHAKAADRCIVIGPAPAAQSYLDQAKVLEAARKAGADAIHPGYGFLSENASFAQAVDEAGLIFVGPRPDAIAAMGDKATSKRLMINAGVPCIPGYEGEDQDDAVLAAEAERIGFPVMVKASAGGGGKGMRIVSNPDDLAEAIVRARSEAEASFGNGRLLIEKAVSEARHVEVQIFADTHGNTVHLGERDCSLQRRHQKVIEEAPSPAVDPDLRERMGQAAVDAARVVSYIGAGTVEFLLASDGSFYFLEMNTRLQVEHPVTEEVTGLDLVALQLRVAEGQPLGFDQSDVKLCGHAIEARLYAEAPEDEFLPQAGPVKLWRAPTSVRTDGGIETGGEISPHYDPMVAKIIARGDSREEARRKLVAALEDTTLLGVRTNRTFLRELLEDKSFVTGQALTTTIDNNEPPQESHPDDQTLTLAAMLMHLVRRDRALTAAGPVPPTLLGWQGGTELPSPYGFSQGDEIVRVTVLSAGGVHHVTVCEKTFVIEMKTIGTNSASISIDGELVPVSYLCGDTAIELSTKHHAFSLTDVYQLSASAADQDGSGAVTAPMHGAVTDIAVNDGDSVKKGDKLIILEAMKMQHELTAPVAGTVTKIAAAVGQQVGAGDVLIVIEPEEEE